MIRLVPATKLQPGMVMALPFKRSAKITGVKVGSKYVNLTLADLPKTRVGRYDEVLIEVDDVETH